MSYTVNRHRVTSLSDHANEYRWRSRREAARAGPVVIKTVSVMGVTYSDFTIDQLLCASLFSHPPLMVLYVVDMSNTESFTNGIYVKVTVTIESVLHSLGVGRAGKNT